MTLRSCYLASLFFFGLVGTVLAQDSLYSKNDQSLFNFIIQQDEEIPSLDLTTDWTNLLKHKKKEEYQTGKLSLKNKQGESIPFDIKLRSRGNTRKEVCFYPPLKIKFKKASLREFGFSDLNKIKMVVQCRKGPIGQDYLLREKLVYDWYECVSPLAYRTKLIRLNLIEEDGKSNSLYAFLIEEEEEFCNRLDADLVEKGTIRSSATERSNYLRMVFFQYMILNTDWDVANKHNIEFIKVPQYDRIVTVPYDFDYSGVVGTNYAIPAPTLPISHVTQPYFRGRKVKEEEAKEMRDFYLSIKDQIFEPCIAYNLLSDSSKKTMLRHLNNFYTLLEKEKAMKRVFVTLR